VRALNSEISVTPIVAPLDPANASEWVESADVVLDCADSVAVTYTLSDVCLQHGVPLVSASVLGLSGYAGAFCADAPSVRAVFPDVPDTLANCSDAGVLGPVVGAIGAVQAQMVMSLLLQLPDSPLGSLWRFDGATLRVSTLRFNGAPEPARHFPFVAASHIRATDRVIELRDVQEAPQAVMASALRCLPADLEALAPATPGQRTVLCCHSGLRAWRAAERLPPKLVAAGQADLAISYQPQLHLQIHEGLPLRRVGTLVATPLNCLLTLEEGPIQSIADLKGKKIGFSVAGVEEAVLKAVLGNHGVALEDVEMVNVNFSLSPALMSGQVDAVIGAFRNFELNQMDIEGVTGRCPRFALRPMGLDSGRYARFEQWLADSGLIDSVNPVEMIAIEVMP